MTLARNTIFEFLAVPFRHLVTSFLETNSQEEPRSVGALFVCKNCFHNSFRFSLTIHTQDVLTKAHLPYQFLFPTRTRHSTPTIKRHTSSRRKPHGRCRFSFWLIKKSYIINTSRVVGEREEVKLWKISFRSAGCRQRSRGKSLERFATAISTSFASMISLNQTQNSKSSRSHTICSTSSTVRCASKILFRTWH